MNQLGDRQPAFFVYDMDTSGSFHQVARLLYIIGDNGTTVTTVRVGHAYFILYVFY